MHQHTTNDISDIKENQITKHHHTFKDYEDDLQAIVQYLSQETKFLHIIAPYRGGLPLGVALSNRLSSPLSILQYQRYDGVPQDIYDGVKFMHNAGITSNECIVLVDDLIDEGITMQKCIAYIRDHFPMSSLKVITIFGKETDEVDADYYYVRERPNCWTVFDAWE